MADDDQPLNAEGAWAQQAEARLPDRREREEIERGLTFGLEAAPTINDRRISTFVRGETAALRGRARNVPEMPVRRGRQQGRRRRGRDLRRAARCRRHLPARHPVRPAGNSALHQPVWHLQLRVGRRPARAAQHGRHRRRVHHPGQPGEVVRPDQPGHGARGVQGRDARRARRRSLHRLPDHPRVGPLHGRQHRHHPLRPPRRHPGIRPRRADAHHAVVPRHQHQERARDQPGADRHRRLAEPPARG